MLDIVRKKPRNNLQSHEVSALFRLEFCHVFSRENSAGLVHWNGVSDESGAIQGDDECPIKANTAGLIRAGGPTVAEFPDLHTLMKMTATTYSGGEPHATAAFVSRGEPGEDTIVSVDGAAPDIALP